MFDLTLMLFSLSIILEGHMNLYCTLIERKENVMNKTEYVAAVADASGMTKAQAALAVDACTAVITKALKSGDAVQITGFGTFEVAKRAARTGRNPATGKEIKIAASKAPKFKAGKVLKDAVK